VETNLEGKTVLVTEAVLNFGQATSLAFAREGCNLMLAAREGNAQLQRTAQEASSLGVKVATQVCDISDQGQAQALAQRAISEFGRIDVLVNNVSFPMPNQSLEQLPFELWQRKIDVEVTGSFLLCKEVIPNMIQQQWGRVINFTGLAAFRGSDPLASTTELGIVGLTRGLSREYGKYNITANCVGPGGVAGEEGQGAQLDPPQDRDALPRWGKPTEVAFLAVCLASEDAGYITGQCLLANGGKYYL
jgi:3-oxoacyl-[acyl-carrier protein] reductase